MLNIKIGGDLLKYFFAIRKTSVEIVLVRDLTENDRGCVYFLCGGDLWIKTI